jgi:nicotinamide-nucleotide amidase
MPFSPELLQQAEMLLQQYRERGWKIATAESCTGGLIAALLTEIPGSSDVFERGFVTYSNESKQELLGVPETLIRTHGAVSEEVARAMAEGALKHSRADVAISVTGIAGPGGGSKEKPVGTVFMGLTHADDTQVSAYRFDGTRPQVRLRSVFAAISLCNSL